MQAQELETGLGGAYSNLAMGLQLPLANYLLKSLNLTIKGTEVKVAIITGLDALSRSGDLDNLRAALMDMANVGMIKEAFPRMNDTAVMQAIFAGHGLPTGKFILSDEDAEAEQQAQIENQAAQAGAVAGAEGAAQAATEDI